MAPGSRAGDTLRRQLGVVLMASGAVLALLVGAAAYSLGQLVTYQHRVTSTYFEATRYAETLDAWLDDAGEGLGSFLRTGVEPALPPFTAPFGGVDYHRSAFSRDEGASSRGILALDEVDHAIATWRSEYVDPVTLLVKASGPGVVPPELTEHGTLLYEHARETSRSFVDTVAAGRAEAAEQLSRWTRNLFLVVVALTVAALVVGLGTWSVLRRKILGPLAVLAGQAEAVSAGALTVEVSTPGPGEISALAGSVDAMRVELVEQMARAQESRAEILRAHDQVLAQAEELRRSNRDLEQFAYVASHDLQEPLRKVASFTQLLRKRYGGRLDERADQYIDFAADGAIRMQGLIEDLLEFSRVGRSLPPPEAVDMREICADALAALDTRVATLDAVVTVGPLPLVTGQRNLLVQLVQNLVGNALKFRAPDRSPRVSIGAVRRGDRWEMWCTDNGIGIDPQYAERVFVIFQRLHPKERYEGTGIGLSLCKKIVEFHGGEIWVDTEGGTGEGTTIRWTLPVAVPAGPEDEADGS